MKYRRGDEEEVGKDYEKIVMQLVSNLESSQRENAMKILYSDKAIKTYELMKEDEISPRIIRNVMLHNLKRFSKGKGLSAGTYLSGVAQDLVRNEEYLDVVEGMREEGVISESTYERAMKDIEGQHKHGVRKVKSGLEDLARAAAFLFMFTGIVIMLDSQFTFTGATIGNGISPTAAMVVGIALFVIGVAAFPRK